MTNINKGKSSWRFIYFLILHFFFCIIPCTLFLLSCVTPGWGHWKFISRLYAKHWFWWWMVKLQQNELRVSSCGEERRRKWQSVVSEHKNVQLKRWRGLTNTKMSQHSLSLFVSLRCFIFKMTAIYLKLDIRKICLLQCVKYNLIWLNMCHLYVR